MQALIVVDVQNDFLPEGALGVKGGDEILPVIIKLMETVPYCVASQDFHPKGHVSFASTHDQKVGSSIMCDGETQILWPDHCVEGTEGVAFSIALPQERIDHIVHKGTHQNKDAYSAFEGTDLEMHLKEKGIDHLIVAGLATDYCVLNTVCDALKLGFAVEVVLDGVKAVNLHEGDGDRALETMKLRGASLTRSKDVLCRQF